MNRTCVRLLAVTDAVVLLAAGVIVGPSLTRAQVGSLQIQAANVLDSPAIETQAIPEFGTFWSMQLGDDSPPLPFFPSDLGDLPGLEIIVLDPINHIYAINDLSVDYQALYQQREAEAALLKAAAKSLGVALNEEPDGSGMFAAYSFTSEDLGLEILSQTNTTALFVVHPPAAEEGIGVYDLYLTTNLAVDVPGLNGTNWQWVLRCGPGQTNLVVSNLTYDVCFFRLARTNDDDGDLMSTAFEQLVSHSDPNNGDQNTNSIPDGWEWNYFGNLDQTAEGDYDVDGVSNLDEYSAGTDPNTIAFDVSFPNLHVNANTATGTVSVIKGVPDKMAVVMDSTNLASASWVSYNSMLLVNLGSTNGTHKVWIGLKGRADTSDATWSAWYLTRDTAAPSIVITNPVATTVSQPMIQLQGYSREPLLSLRYDVTNAAGSLTNEEGYVIKQWLDTNLFELTTNWFECVDIGLTNGTNVITLRATDRAGNVSTNVYNYVLSYAGDTNAPVFKLYWPQNNTQISGTNFTLRGFIDDATASVTAQIVGTNGVTNIVSGLVERNGLVWVEDLPLGGGTNTLTLTMTDAATNTSVTNISVIKSALTLTVDDFSGTDLNQSFINVTGTIGTSGYTVWVNGVKVTNYSSGTWSVANVPLNEGGTALVQARAISNSDNSGNGTGGGGAPSNENLANPTSPTAVDNNPEEEKAAEVVMIHYHKDWEFTSVEREETPPIEHQTKRIQWDLNKPGSSFADRCFGGPLTPYYGWSDAHWGTDGIGTIYGDLTAGTNVCGVREYGTNSYYTIPDWPGESCKGSDTRVKVYGSVWDEVVTRDALTLYELHTGGKAHSQKKNLFVLSASVTGLRNFFFSEIDFNAEDPNDLSPGQPYTIAPTVVQLGDLGKLGSDGNLYKALPNNETHDITPYVSSSRYFRYDKPNALKHKLTIVANGYPLADDRVRPLAEYCVGQKVNFQAVFSPDPSGLNYTSPTWNYTADYVNNHYTSSTGCEIYNIAPIPAMSNPTTAWFYNKQTQDATANLGLYCKFNNGQSVYLIRRGKFNVFTPSMTFIPSGGFTVNVRHYGAAVLFGVGQSDGTGALGMSAKIDSIPKFPGQAMATQLVNRQASIDGIPFGTGGTNELDNSEIYPGSQASLTNDVNNPHSNLSGTVTVIDQPGIPITVASWASGNDHFNTYFRFKPDGDADSIYVTLGRADWDWHGNVLYTGGIPYNPWSLSNWTISGAGVGGPTFNQVNDFPVWAAIYSNFP